MEKVDNMSIKILAKEAMKLITEEYEAIFKGTKGNGRSDHGIREKETRPGMEDFNTKALIDGDKDNKYE